MAKVLTASLSPNCDGDLSVAIANSFTGEDLCKCTLPAHSTLADLEHICCHPHGPLSQWHQDDWFGPQSRLCIYRGHQLLDLNMPCTPGSLVIKHGDVEAWLQTLPDTGKFLEAMRLNKFVPSSENFDRKWTAKSAPAVPTERTEGLVEKVLRGYPSGPHSGPLFVRIFGKLITCGEAFSMLNLSLLQDIGNGLRTFKHCVCQHWLRLARGAATSMLSEAETTPILLIKRSFRGRIMGCCVIGDAFPDSFDGRLQQALLPLDLMPDTRWETVSHALLSLDWNPRAGQRLLQDLWKKTAKDQEPDEFKKLTTGEVSLMVHVQLRLSCCGVAEVNGSINEASAKILAELLAYKLKILKFQSSLELKAELRNFNHRGTLVLVKDIPSSKMKSFAGPHRMILCHSRAPETTARGRSRSPRR